MREYHEGGSGEKLKHEQSGYKGRRRWDRLVKEYHEGGSGEKLNMAALSADRHPALCCLSMKHRLCRALE